ncbi:PREDICTED: ATP-dependent DNA helicase Q1-like [Acropora digitifera]|uniref:ATP-dependent DNA helicase Q1-like n=1 Tax=Acropora digitifera TaxID=70779 RepID=UPI00077B1C85|nr:PREDICTED: ATP-dependent DNA helicase Q1-like [Acropora digitifera]
MDDLKKICEGKIGYSECFSVLGTFPKNKTPGNVGLTIEFYIAFWRLFGGLLVDSLNYAFDFGELSNSQKQAIITLMEKKGKDKSTPVAALTGTADERTRKTIQESLALKVNLLTVYVSPNRENLRFSVKKVKKEQQMEELHWLIELIKQHAKDTPKTLIFCNTLNEIAQVTNYLLSKLGPHAYDQQNKVPQNCFLGVYHSNSWDRNKERISNSLKARNGSIKRVVVATTALCMGVNFPDIRYIITWGAARSLLDFHQEAGCAGRDGVQSHVVVLYHGQQVRPCEKEVKQFLKTNGCLRVGAYQSLDKNIKSLSPLHNCCSFCATERSNFARSSRPGQCSERSCYKYRDAGVVHRQYIKSWFL